MWVLSIIRFGVCCVCVWGDSENFGEIQSSGNKMNTIRFFLMLMVLSDWRPCALFIGQHFWEIVRLAYLVSPRYPFFSVLCQELYYSPPPDLLFCIWPKSHFMFMSQYFLVLTLKWALCGIGPMSKYRAWYLVHHCSPRHTGSHQRTCCFEGLLDFPLIH